MEQTFTVDDNCLPSAQELSAYKSIDPKIVDYLINASVKEQEHRHLMDRRKLDVLRKSETRDTRINWWGMFFAFLSVVVLVGLCGYALYLDRPWFAGFMGAGAFVAIVSIFVNGKEGNIKKK